MNLLRKKLASLAAGVALMATAACSSGNANTSANTDSTSGKSSDVGVSLRMLGFGDSVSFEVIAKNTSTLVEYTSALATVSGSASVPASGTATIASVPFGNYSFTINVYDSSSVLLVSQTYDNSGSGYDVLTNAYSIAFTVNITDGDDISGEVSTYTSTISVTGNLDFPPTPDLDVNDISLLGNFGTATDDVTATFGDVAVAFYDYEDASSAADPLDLCIESGAVSLDFAVVDASSNTCALSSGVSVAYYDTATSDYTSATCGTGTSLDCCRFEVNLEEADLSSCASTTFETSDKFQIILTGADSNGNSATATVNVDISI